MSLTESTGGSSSPESVALGEALTFFGAVADFAAGALPEDGERIASLAVAMARHAGLSSEDCDALYFAARLRNAGALGNAGLAKRQNLSERDAAAARWDIPAEGARLCERIAALPAATADIVRWQSECWDGTGFPDQLRWSGIPQAAQLLHVAIAAVEARDVEEAFTNVTAESGRAFAPEQARTFSMWFHLSGGEIEPVAAPYGALAAGETGVPEIVALLSERIDLHNATPGRARRIAGRAQEIGRGIGLGPGDLRDLELAALLFGAGELREREPETAQFGPLARLGIETRARNAVTAANLIATVPAFGNAVPIVRARGEWYDGSGGPDRLRHDHIPAGAHVLAVAIAFDAVDEDHRSRIGADRVFPIARIEKAAGTQFHPNVVRALAEVLKTHA